MNSGGPEGSMTWEGQKVSLQTIARRYATALAEVAVERKEEDNRSERDRFLGLAHRR